MPEQPRFGSDVIVDLLSDAGIEHVAFNPGASFRGIHDSLVHRQSGPELTLCLHECIAVSVAQGYAKATGKPMAALLHNVVGLQNASMAIYNAWCDRTPMLLLGGTGPKSKPARRPWIDWIHTASVQGNLVRDFVKWDDEPHDLASVPESFVRGLTTAVSEPGGPVYLCYDVDIQEEPVHGQFTSIDVNDFAVPSAPAADEHAVSWLAEALRGAAFPFIVAGYVGEGTEAFESLTELAEALGAPVVDTGVRHAFPTTHPLAATHVPGLLDKADVVLALDVEDMHGVLGNRLDDPSTTILNVSLSTLKLRSWAHDYQSMVPARRHITASADSVVAALLDRFRRAPLPVADVRHRTQEVTAATSSARRAWQQQGRDATADGVVAQSRLLYELGRALEGTKFVLGGATNARNEHKYLALERPRQYAGWGAGGGLGYGVGGAIGVALGQDADTITVDVQADGDLLFLPSALWTAANRALPLLVVVHNNRQYGNTVEHAMRIAETRGRGPERRYVGAGITDPAVDIAAMARSFGVWAAGPISNADDYAEALSTALDVVRSGRPALLDVLTPGF